jgi:hypothetical protein
MTVIDADTIVRVPEHVAHRPFTADTVALNVKSGNYHGLNHTAGRMFELLREHGRVGAAAEAVAAEFGQPAATVLADMVVLCEQLVERDLLEVVGPGPPAAA